jgi:hypothetical protein
MQVDHHVVGVQREQVVVSGFDAFLPLFPGGHADGLDGLDPERFDNGFHVQIL